MSKKTTRRTFVKSTAALGLGLWAAGGVSAKPSRSALEEISFGCIGIGGKGSEDSADANNTERHGSRVIAVCDIDDEALAKDKEKFPGAKHFNDFRKMLEQMGDSIDAVTVSTPDHTHAVAALMAMRMGKHVYCQKPMTHSIEEARMMADVAREKKIMTQMGNQHTANPILRQSAALIQAGVIGPVKEVHIWTDRPVWPQGFGLKVDEPPTPARPLEGMDWAGKTSTLQRCVPRFQMAWILGFRNSALGDMACHTVNMAYMALNLRNPTSVSATTDKHDRNCYPASSVIEYEFPELDRRPALKMTWYDGGKKPLHLLTDCPKSKDEDGRERIYSSGALLIGEKGKFFSPGDYGGEAATTGVVVDGEFTQQLRLDMKADYERSPGHFMELTNAIRGNGKPVSNFDEYAGGLTETTLLGNLSVWTGKKIEWDASKMAATNMDDESVARMVRHDYLNGYTIHA